MGIPRGKYFAFSNVNNEYDECSRESRDVRRLTWCANYICVCAWCTNFTTLVNCREGCKNLSWHLILFCLPPFVKAHWNLLLFFVQCVSGSSWLRRLAFLWCGILETLAKKWFQCICVIWIFQAPYLAQIWCLEAVPHSSPLAFSSPPWPCALQPQCPWWMVSCVFKGAQILYNVQLCNHQAWDPCL